ncbi:hypothetical protein FEM48_Zijuj12G0122700 [Ziziphus jujuba var. spinosa]|uniref:B3 domain-containing protein n=1 Tax=Ziziphus jujuba var. spinosa TaxID=714518 RepID=A0A978UD99_ZIZJJ|nr:hypothetical protein FEM48_Zijuj12G0122700 [Ziziphus jujuba var. spinosa]
MGGKEIRLGIQKEITEADLKREHNRLSMPCSQMIGGGFLTEEEKDTLRKQEAIEAVPLMIKRFQPPAEQRMEVANINLRQWDMPKPSGKASSIYVLRTSWQYVVNRIGLRVHDVVQVWSFRIQEDRLHLALVVGFDFKTSQSGIDLLAHICGVALDVLEHEKRRRRKGKEIVRDRSLSPSLSVKACDQIVHGLKLRIPKPTTTTTPTTTSITMAWPLKRSRNNRSIMINKKKIIEDEQLGDGDGYDEDHQVKNSKKTSKKNRAVDQIVHGLKLNIPKPSSPKRSRNQEEESDDHMIQVKNSKKRSRNQEESDDDDGDDWDTIEVKNSKKSKKRQIRRPSNFVRRSVPVANGASYRELPGEFRREIEAMGGRDIKLGIQKQLTETDLKPHHNRLLIPVRQIIDGDFLTDAEKSILSRHQVMEDVPLLMKETDGERMEVMNINMTQWDMAKQSGKASSCNYVLRTSWQDVARMNRLQKDDVVQIWSFRVQEYTLHLALVVVQRANHQLRLLANTGSTSTAGSAGTSGSSTGNGSGSSSNGSSTGNNGRCSSGSSGNTHIC